MRVTGISSDPQTPHVQIEVLDSGIGFSRLDEATLYQTFFQIDSSMTREYSGLGIGLAICRQLVELMGGTLNHASELGCGSCFTLRVPLSVSEAEPQLRSSAFYSK